MGSPNTYFSGFGSVLPSSSVTMRREMMHLQGSVECESWHSVGHLCVQGISNESWLYVGSAYLVQVPEARGRVIPDMASISDDFPALCAPKTAMVGISRSNCALQEVC